MDSLGNTDLWECHLVAFFASRSVSPEAENRCIAWAESICKTDSVVISGFHSPLEKRVLHLLLEQKHPVILFLGRAMYKRIPTEYQEAIDEGRMLIVSVRNNCRHSNDSAETRNWNVARFADEIFMSPFDNDSLLSAMHYNYAHCSKVPITIL